MTPEYVDGTRGPTEVMDAADVTRRMAEMLSDPNVDHVRVRLATKAASAAKTKATRRRANKNARRERHR